MKVRSLACFKFQVISYYNVYMYVYILSFSISRTSSAWNMHHGAQSSAQGACCLDSGFRHIFSAPDCAAFEVMRVYRRVKSTPK